MKLKRKSSNLLIGCLLLAWALAARPAAAAAAATPGPAAGETYAGTVMAVSPDQHTVKVAGRWGFGKTFQLGRVCAYALLDGPAASPAGLHAGQQVRVTYQNLDGVLAADRIEQEPVWFSGWVKAVNPGAGTLTVQPGRWGLTRQFRVIAGSRVTLRDGQPGTLGDLHPGNPVRLTYETPPGLATVRELAQTSAAFTGYLTAIDLDARTFRARAAYDSRAFHLGDHGVIDLDGRGHGRLGDLRPEEKVMITYDSINGVNVANRVVPGGAADDSAVAAPGPGGF